MVSLKCLLETQEEILGLSLRHSSFKRSERKGETTKTEKEQQEEPGLWSPISEIEKGLQNGRNNQLCRTLPVG